MIISKNSSHFRFNKWFEKISNSHYNEDEVIESTRSLCPYFWKTLLRVLFTPFVLIREIALVEIPNTPAIVIDFERDRYIPRTFILLLTFCIYFLLFVACYIAISPIILIVYMICGIPIFDLNTFVFPANCAFLLTALSVLFVRYNKSYKGFMYLFELRWKAFKEKNCPMIKFE